MFNKIKIWLRSLRSNVWYFHSNLFAIKADKVDIIIWYKNEEFYINLDVMYNQVTYLHKAVKRLKEKDNILYMANDKDSDIEYLDKEDLVILLGECLEKQNFELAAKIRIKLENESRPN